jgi:hypothetical protein
MALKTFLSIKTAIQADGFRSLADGEVVEFLVEQDQNGRKKAARVTGPDGANVQGARSVLKTITKDTK